MNFPAWVLYPSLYKPEDTALAQRFKQSIDPRRAELYLFGLENDVTDLLVQESIRDFGTKFDVDIDKGQANIDDTMARRVKAHVTQQPAYLIEGEFTDSPVSTNPSAFLPFDLEAYIREQGGFNIRELWISNESGDGAYFVPGIDATARNINGTGNPRCNVNMLTDWISDTPGENGALVWADKFGFRVDPGTEGANRFQCIMIPGSRGWAFIAANPTADERERIEAQAKATAKAAKKPATAPPKPKKKK